MKNEGDNKQKKFSTWFWERYFKYVLLMGITFAVILIIIYFVFAFTSPVPAGKNLTRADWLAFIGGILALFGSILVSVISITQASYFNEMEQNRQEKQRSSDEKERQADRVNLIKPELAIVIKGRNLRIPYIDKWSSNQLHKAMFGVDHPDRYKEKQKSPPEAAIFQQLNTERMIQEYPVDNIWISIVNIGNYPVKHLEIYGEYYYPFLRPGESIELILTLDAYPRKTSVFSSSNGLDTINNSNSVIKIIDVRNEIIDVKNAHIDEPKQYDHLWIDYEDVDGNAYQQHFRMHPSGIGSYYCNDGLIEDKKDKHTARKYAIEKNTDKS